MTKLGRQHAFVDRNGRNLCDLCDKYAGWREHEPAQRSDDYKLGYQAGYQAGKKRAAASPGARHDVPTSPTGTEEAS